MANRNRETMSLVPEVELGLWNAWIFTVPSLLLVLFSLRLFVEKRAPATGMRLSKTKLSFCLFFQVYLFCSRDILCFLAAKIRYDMVLRRSPNYSNRISREHDTCGKLG
jgi:hypothetical protein